MPNLARSMAHPATRGTRVARNIGSAHRCRSRPARPRANQVAIRAMASTHAYPVVARLRLVRRTSRPQAVTRPHDGRSITPPRANRLAQARATLHARSSEYTSSCDAKNTKTEPAKMENRRTCLLYTSDAADEEDSV